MIRNEDLATICRRIGEKVNASSRTLTVVALKLNEHGGTFRGNRDAWCREFSYQRLTVYKMTEILMRKGVIVAEKVPIKTGGLEIASYSFDEAAIMSMLAVAGPDPTKHKVKEVRGKCGHKTSKLYDGVCYGCHISAMVNRQRKGKRRV